MSEERVEYYGITDPPGVTIPDELKPYMLELIRLQKEVQKYQWISVKDRNPKISGDYLVVYQCREAVHPYREIDRRWIDIAHFNCRRSRTSAKGWPPNNWGDVVTHWMPFPELPEEIGVENDA